MRRAEPDPRGRLNFILPVWAIIFCSFFLLTTLPSFSQTSGMRFDPGGWMMHRRGENQCWRASDLNLSSEQMKELELIQQDYFRETQGLRASLFTKRLELRELLLNPTVKIDSIRLKHTEIIKLEITQEEKRIEYLIKVKGLLNEEQLKSWCPEEEFPHFRGMMHGPGSMAPMHPRKPPPPEGSKGE